MSLAPRDVAHDGEREFALLGVARNLDDRLVESDGEILLQTLAALGWRAGGSEDIRGRFRQQPDGAIEIVTRMRGDDRRVIDVEIGRLDVVGMTSTAEQEGELP